MFFMPVPARHGLSISTAHTWDVLGRPGTCKSVDGDSCIGPGRFTVRFFINGRSWPSYRKYPMMLTMHFSATYRPCPPTTHLGGWAQTRFPWLVVAAGGSAIVSIINMSSEEETALAITHVIHAAPAGPPWPMATPPHPPSRRLGCPGTARHGVIQKVMGNCNHGRVTRCSLVTG